MRLFLDLPIRKKLTVVIIVANVIALLLAGTASVVYDVSLFRRAAVREAMVQADLLGIVCARTLARSSPGDAQNRLSELRDQKQIVSARLFNAAGTLFAQYERDPAAPPAALNGRSLTEGFHLENGYVSIVKRLYSNSRLLGTLVLRTRTNELQQHLELGLGTVAAALLISTLLALLFSRQVQRAISDPIQNLAKVVTAVELKNDYSLRAFVAGADEIGALVNGVNKMLEEIQKHEGELQESEERFRQVTESIREVVWMTDTTKHQCIYVSPSYEETWGRRRSKLYESPWDWLEAIHPDDRERVRKAVTSKQIAGTYDEEYRVVQPDGTIRWIRDRAFPVCDANGKVYRLAGIAEDVTERRLLEQEVLEISDREQERIGQDLHDGLCQHLASIAMTCSLLKRRLVGLSNPEARLAERICHQLEDAIAQARNLARGVSSLDLADDNLAPALQALASSVSKEFGIPCELDFSGTIAFDNTGVVTSLYRIAREAVYNAAKHARPHQICIELQTQPDVVCLRVTDDGVGFDSPPKNGNGMGLGLMKYRASMIGAELRIERPVQGGTVMTCNLPRNHF